MEKLNRIKIGDKKYPIKIDLNVLEHIQNEYGTINQFERDLLGLKYKKDEEGKQIYKDGEPVMVKTETSIRAIKTALPAAINEGLTIEADAENRPVESVTENFVIRNCTIPYDMLGQIIHDEFRKCFVTKK